MNSNDTIVITGGAGLVGQNLVVALRDRGYQRIRVVDKSAHNLVILRELHPEVETFEADLAVAGPWIEQFRDAAVVVSLHAQIGGLSGDEFERNNVLATERLLQALEGRPDCYVLHVSSSVVMSEADDFYTRSKARQEQLVMASPNPWYVLRPTLMFGWFDRKHFGWLSRFMRRVPIFPIPGSGRYLRQPLYAGDFCNVLIACIEQRPTNECMSISGTRKIPYIEIVRKIKQAVGSRALIVRIPVSLFGFLLRVYAIFDRDPPFTVNQMQALVIDEIFEDTGWEQRFGVSATPLDEALNLTFRDARYSGVVLEF